jgi:Xaa-Pro aminopeptidase
MNRTPFAERRREFLQRMQPGVAVFASAPVRQRNHDVEHEYRQDSDFFYLTGFDEPESWCVLSPGHRRHEYVLFVRPRDREKEIWNGYRAGVEGAIQQYGAEMAYTNDQLEEILTEMLQDAPALYFSLQKYPETDGRILAIVEQVRKKHKLGIYPPSQIIDPREMLSEMRLVKKEGDLECLTRAVEISAKAHTAAMKWTAPGKHEYQIQAVLEYVFREAGSMRNGYQCIVGSGPNACILHYRENTRQMQDGDLLLVDAGAEFGYYTGDITRTYPVNGRFTPEQKAVYEAVLSVQKLAIDRARAGNTIMSVHEFTVRKITEAMVDLGILSGSVDQLIENKDYEKYYMHRTGHWLGMDVHDAGRMKRNGSWRALEPGMVMTVEPGLYIPPDDEHERFRGIGVRIEDDVLITADGPRVLSSACPKEVSELESIVGSRAKEMVFL